VVTLQKDVDRVKRWNKSLQEGVVLENHSATIKPKKKCQIQRAAASFVAEMINTAVSIAITMSVWTISIAAIGDTINATETICARTAVLSGSPSAMHLSAITVGS